MHHPQQLKEAPEEGWFVQLPGAPESIAVAREFTRKILHSCPNIDAIALVVSELTTNAVLHSRSGQGGTFRLWLLPINQGIAVFVYDDGPPTGATFDRGDVEDFGRGLQIVEHFATAWGSAGDTPGKHATWADMPWNTSHDTDSTSAV